MCDVPVFYATTDGQTRRIAERLAEEFRQHGLASEAIDVESPDASGFDWDAARGVCLGASIRAGRHQASAMRFAHLHHSALSALPSLFFSVSLSAASRREGERQTAEQFAQAFVMSAGWQPSIVACVAGCLAYTRYSLLTRWLMWYIARKEGGPTDTTRDHELTDWAAVSALARRFSELCFQAAQAQTSSAARAATMMAIAGEPERRARL